MQVNYYYSIRHDDATDQDLLQLCRVCANEAGEQVKWASRGDEECECEFCGLSNDETRSQALDARYSAVTRSPAPRRRVA